MYFAALYFSTCLDPVFFSNKSMLKDETIVAGLKLGAELIYNAIIGPVSPNTVSSADTDVSIFSSHFPLHHTVTTEDIPSTSTGPLGTVA
jgi:hypothetical protein